MSLQNYLEEELRPPNKAKQHAKNNISNLITKHKAPRKKNEKKSQLKIIKFTKSQKKNFETVETNESKMTVD